MPASSSATTAATNPAYPATAVSTSDSCSTIPTTDAGVAPTARRRPISRVRSCTTISMMLLTPTTPAARVITPTNHTKSRIPRNSTVILRNSSSALKAPMAFSSSGWTL